MFSVVFLVVLRPRFGTRYQGHMSVVELCAGLEERPVEVEAEHLCHLCLHEGEGREGRHDSSQARHEPGGEREETVALREVRLHLGEDDVQSVLEVFR